MKKMRSRRRRAPKRTARTLVLMAAVAVATAMIAPSVSMDAKRTMREQLAAIEHAVARTAQRAGDWIGVGTGTVRDALAQGASGPTIAGSARVVDGDTLEIGGTRVRLHGIDAPESKQRCRAGGRTWPCGREAARALARRIGGHTVTCETRDRDRYGRTIAVCRTGGSDMNGWMAAEGWALAYRSYSRDYVAEENRARAAKRGVWRGEMIAPWDWRRGMRLAREQSTAQPAASPATSQRGTGGCTIKGNIGKSGTRIYHVPGARFYDATHIDTSKGERWFCSETQARAAGWRRARRWAKGRGTSERTKHDATLLEPPPRPGDRWSHGQGSSRSASIAAMGTDEHPMSLGTEYFEGTLKR